MTRKTPAETAAVAHQRILAKQALARVLVTWVRDTGLTQEEGAKRLNVYQPLISNIVRGKLDLISIDQLLTLLFRAGYRTDLEVTMMGPSGIPTIKIELK